MGPMEISLIIIGVVILVASFLIKDRTEEEKLQSTQEVKNITQEMIKEEVQNQLAMLSDDVLEHAESKLEKLATQKIMDVGNYSEDVLKNIEDNHNEVMFLYNMLNDKETTLKNTVRDIEAVKRSVKKMAGSENTEKKNLPKKPAQEQAISPKSEEETITVKEQREPVEKKEKILELQKKGKTNVEIAKELNLGVGEVNLVLGLYQ